MHSIKNKFKSRQGETFAESLAAVLLVALISVTLSVSIAAAVRVNTTAQSLAADCSMERSDDTRCDSATLIISYSSKTEDISYDIQAYEDNGYYFYDAQ